MRVIVRVADPDLPTFKQVSAVQEEINKRQDIRFRLVVQRNAVDVAGPEEKPNAKTPFSQELIDTRIKSVDSTTSINDIKPLTDVPPFEVIPFSDDRQSFKKEPSINLNSTAEFEATNTPDSFLERSPRVD